ncbi:hypothetical protein QQF64_032640 [Cirrhinus molitorella]|uniref:Uncharacterized protein n=1 Tax=Cirrhinus molitorella TaxID=172907 RepID=A0ABR3MRQ9_9TELE
MDVIQMSVVMLELLEAACFYTTAGIASLYLTSELSGAAPALVCLSVGLSVVSGLRVITANPPAPRAQHQSARCSRPPVLHPFLQPV